MLRRLLQLLSWLALAGTIVPPALYLAGQISLLATQRWMLAATLLWFASTPFWMGRKRYEPDLDAQPVAP